jgi:hypothetical protein
MTTSSAKAAPCLGFLTAIENADWGIVGGYLVLNAAGRPLEFHCTAPLKPTRAQQILYGATLQPYLYGEQIGQALLTKSKLTPLVVCTDSEPVLAARDFVQFPMVLVLPPEATAAHASAAHGSPVFALGKSQVSTAAHYSGDQQLVRDTWPGQADCLDLFEPFTRIREALDEAQRTARQAA